MGVNVASIHLPKGLLSIHTWKKLIGGDRFADPGTDANECVREQEVSWTHMIGLLIM